MKYAEKSCVEFTDATFSNAPVPGGGGVSALAGALGTALGGMVCNLTTGKKKYAQYEEDIQRIMKEANEIKDSLITMIDQDAENFLPLSKAYGLPTSTDEEKAHKAKVMEECLKGACSVPVDIVKTSYKVIALMEELAVKGSSLALSDVGVGVALLRSAITGGWLNVVININSIKDAEYVANVRKEVEPLVTEGMAKCDEIYMKVWKTLQK
ncbi:MAG: cyclodeaminase/cyclohydrolase family protein [Eubacteriaceae bacterium]|nr:cyclodeaminase/cyclohydrolase family protein [Eubacteriaceae bacterium]